MRTVKEIDKQIQKEHDYIVQLYNPEVTIQKEK